MTANETSIACVLFDLDGTLIDTAADFSTVLDTMKTSRSQQKIAAEQVHQSVSNGARALVNLAFNVDEGDPEFDILLQELLDLYLAQLRNTEARLYPGMLDLLEELEQTEISWGVVTNKPEKFSTLLLQQLNLLKRCGVLICPDHVSHRKPNPEPLLLACEKLACSTDRTMYIGDHQRDMQAAKNADIIAVAAEYGYLATDDDISLWNADFVVKSVPDISRLLKILKFA